MNRCCAALRRRSERRHRCRQSAAPRTEHKTIPQPQAIMVLWLPAKCECCVARFERARAVPPGERSLEVTAYVDSEELDETWQLLPLAVAGGGRGGGRRRRHREEVRLEPRLCISSSALPVPSITHVLKPCAPGPFRRHFCRSLACGPPCPPRKPRRSACTWLRSTLRACSSSAANSTYRPPLFATTLSTTFGEAAARRARRPRHAWDRSSGRCWLATCRSDLSSGSSPQSI